MAVNAPLDWSDIKKNAAKFALRFKDVRNEYADQTYADLYNPLTMPPDLLKAHHALDAEVEKAYSPHGFEDDDARISFLFKKNEEKTA